MIYYLEKGKLLIDSTVHKNQSRQLKVKNQVETQRETEVQVYSCSRLLKPLTLLQQ